MIPYDDDRAAARYIWNHHNNRLPSTLYAYCKFVVYGRKNPNSYADGIGADLARFEAKYGNMDVDGIMMAATAELRDEKISGIVIQRCPACHRIASSPLAEQCAYCPHEWRGTNPHRKAWDEAQKRL